MKTIDEKLIKKIEALLNTKGCTEAEAQSRVAKAQELLEKYNLDLAMVGQNKTARKDNTRKGGLYSWQRNLWKAVAELNFCHYLSIKGLERGSTYQHRIIGSHANVVQTEHMAQYLQDTVERLAQEWAKANFYKSVFVREAIAYREGITNRLSERLRDRRETIVAEARKAEQERKQAQARTNADPGTTALTILDVISSEADFNNDYLNNWELGTTARNRAESEARSKAWSEEFWRRENAKSPEQKAKEAEELAKWVAEQNKKAEKRQRRINKTPPKPRYRKATPEEERAGMGSYYEGRAKGNEVGIDDQVKAGEKRGALR
jgi:hypothetical protein